MNIIQNKKIFLAISLVLMLISLAIIFTKGLRYSIEFTGGTSFEIGYQQRPPVSLVQEKIASLGISADVKPLGDTHYVVTTNFLDEDNQQLLLTTLTNSSYEEEIENSEDVILETQNTLEQGVLEQLSSVGPSIGEELRSKAIWAIILVSLGIILFIAYSFRGVGKPVSSWKYGVVAVIALLHDLIIPIGILTILSIQVDTLYVVGLLSILGISVNDTIVVFDRIREKLKINQEKNKEQDFEDLVNEGVNETILRSLFTSLTLLVVLVALYFFGPETTRNLSLVLLLGTVIGTYSSIFVASPLLTYFVSIKDDILEK